MTSLRGVLSILVIIQFQNCAVTSQLHSVIESRTAGTYHVRAGSKVQLNFEVRISSFPQEDHFFLHRILSNSQNEIVASNKTVKALGNQCYNLTVNFIPIDSGNYSLWYHSIRSKSKSDPVTIDIVKVDFADTGAWRRKNARRGDTVPIVFDLICRLALKPNNFRVYHLSRENERLNLLRLKNKTQIQRLPDTPHGPNYHVTIFLAPKDSGRYQVVVDLYGVENQSPTFEIAFTESLDGRPFAAIPICVIVAVVIGAVLMRKLQRKKVFASFSERYSLLFVKTAIEVTILLPGGIRIPFMLYPSHSLSTIIANARLFDPNLFISDVRWCGKSLTDSCDWSSALLTATWAIEAADELEIRSRPSIVWICAYRPVGRKKKRSILLGSEERGSEIRKRASEEAKWIRDDNTTIVISQGAVRKSDSGDSRLVKGIGNDEDCAAFFDPNNGERVPAASITYRTWTFLWNSSLLPSAPGMSPELLLLTNCKFLDCHMQSVRTDDLWLSDYVVMLRGIQCGINPSKYFWLCDGDYLDPQTGRTGSLKHIQSAGQRWWILLLLRDGDRPPEMRIPAGRNLDIATRSGVDLEIKEKTVSVESISTPPNSMTWKFEKTNRFTDDFTDAARNSIEVTIRFSDRFRSFFLQPSHTLSDVIIEARRLDPFTPIGDVCWSETSLTSRGDWRTDNITANWAVTSGDELTVVSRPAAVRLQVWNPHGEHQMETVQLYAEENCSDLRRTAKAIPELQIDDAAVIISEEMIPKDANGNERWIRGFNHESKCWGYFRQTGGQADPRGSIERFFWCFRRDFSLLPSAVQTEPEMTVFTKCKCFQVSQRSLKAVPLSNLWCSDFVLMLCGLQCGCDPPKFFWELRDGRYVDQQTGADLWGEWKIDDKGERWRIFLLLKDGDHPPRIAMPPNGQLDIKTRAGVQLEVMSDVIRVKSAPSWEDLERWVFSPFWVTDSFAKELSMTAMS